MVNVHGQGRCAITLDPHGPAARPAALPGRGRAARRPREPLQHLSQVLEHYMLQSEQLDTAWCWRPTTQVAAGLLIQRLPVEGEGNLGGRRNEDDIGRSRTSTASRIWRPR
jgi:molecular chaperone Hsp33